jgi:multidrug efflux pump subunit AcrA (membrane-fusion protein)
MRKNLLIGLVCLCVGLAIWKFYPKSSVSSIDQNDIVSVSTGSIENRIDVVAKVALVNKETLYFKQSGKIASVSILEGAPVKQ